MKRNYESLREPKETGARLKELYLASHRGWWTWQAAGAVFGLAEGIVAALLGPLLSAGAWALGDGTDGLSLHGVGSTLLLSTIPLLLVGGHCLDLLEKRMEQGGRIHSERESNDPALEVGRSCNHRHLSLLASLYLVHFIVWRTLRARRLSLERATHTADGEAHNQAG